MLSQRRLFAPIFLVISIAACSCSLEFRETGDSVGISQTLAAQLCAPCNSSHASTGGGTGSASDPFLVCSAAQLAAIDTDCGTQSNWASKTFLQCVDLDLAGSVGNPSTPICHGSSFLGTYDGGHKKITAFYFSNVSQSNVGLFEHLTGGTVVNLDLVNATVSGNARVGSLVGLMDGGAQVLGCSSTGVSVTGASGDVGGLVGKMYDADNKIDHSSTSGIVTATGGGTYGGLIGTAVPNGMTTHYIWNSSSSATVSAATGSTVGGLIGYGDSGTRIVSSYATGDVTGSGYTGGLAGFLDSGPGISRLDSSYATGNVTSTGIGAGGLIGDINYCEVRNSHATGNVSGVDGAGGLIGYSSLHWSTGLVSGSYATGNVSGHDGVGGLIGDGMMAIDNVYATGNVTGNAHVGGLIGTTGDQAWWTGVSTTVPYLTNAFSKGSVTGTSSVGGLIGTAGLVAALNGSPSTTPVNALVVTDSYWDTTTSGQATSAAGTAKNTSLMQTASTYSTWPGTVWAIAGGSYPYLK